MSARTGMDYVELSLLRNRGWPWPEDSWGLTPMFGETGWCRACGVPRGPQTGGIVLQRSGLTVKGAWVPHWRYDEICLEEDLARYVASRYRLTMLEVGWPRAGTGAGRAWQVVVPSVGPRWFDHEELRARATERHGVAGRLCGECGVWRWMPLSFGSLPPLRIESGLDGLDLAASPEWFGDGWKAFRQILVRRDLAELLTAASPKDFRINEVS